MLDVDQGGGSVLGEAAQRLTQQAVPKPLLKEATRGGRSLVFTPRPASSCSVAPPSQIPIRYT